MDPVARDPAATVVQAVEVAAWAAAVLPAAVASPAAPPEVAVVVVVPIAVVAAVAAEWEEAVVVAVRPEVGAEAAQAVNSSLLNGASRLCGAPFFY